MRFILALFILLFTLIWFFISFQYFSQPYQYILFASYNPLVIFLLLIGLFLFGYVFGRIFTGDLFFAVEPEEELEESEHDDDYEQYLKSFDFSRIVQQDNVFPTNAPDNLKTIEGIGPKIEELLRSKGLDSFEKISETSVKDLQFILQSFSPSTGVVHNPSTWPKQARLAHQGKWQELKEYQSRLYRGIGA